MHAETHPSHWKIHTASHTLNVLSWLASFGCNQIDSLECHCVVERSIEITTLMNSHAIFVNNCETVFQGFIIEIATVYLHATESEIILTLHAPLSDLKNTKKLRHYHDTTVETIFKSLLKTLEFGVIKTHYIHPSLQHPIHSFTLPDANDYQIFDHLCCLLGITYYCHYSDYGCELWLINASSASNKNHLLLSHKSQTIAMHDHCYYERSDLYSCPPKQTKVSGFSLAGILDPLVVTLQQNTQNAKGFWHYHTTVDLTKITSDVIKNSWNWQQHVVCITTECFSTKINDTVTLKDQDYQIIAMHVTCQIMPTQKYLNRLILIPTTCVFQVLMHNTQQFSHEIWQAAFMYPLPDTVMPRIDLKQSSWQIGLITESRVDEDGLYPCQIPGNTEPEFMALPLATTQGHGDKQIYGSAASLKKPTKITLLQTHLGTLILGELAANTMSTFILKQDQQAYDLEDNENIKSMRIENQGAMQSMVLQSVENKTSLQWNTPNDHLTIACTDQWDETTSSHNVLCNTLKQSICGDFNFTAKKRVDVKCLHSYQINSQSSEITSQIAQQITCRDLLLVGNELSVMLSKNWHVDCQHSLNWQSHNQTVLASMLSISSQNEQLQLQKDHLKISGLNIRFIAPLIEVAALHMNPELLTLLQTALVL